MDSGQFFKVEAQHECIHPVAVPPKKLALEQSYNLNLTLASPAEYMQYYRFVVPAHLSEVHSKLFTTEVTFWHTDEEESAMSQLMSWRFDKNGNLNRRLSDRPRVPLELNGQIIPTPVLGAHFSERPQAD